MKMTVLFMIESGKEVSLTTEAFSKKSANIYITADSIDKARALLPTGELQAAEAMRNYTEGQEEPAQEGQLHYELYTNKAIEEMEADAAEYLESKKGQRFQKSLENARTFYFKKHTGKGGLSCSNLEYLTNIYHNSLLSGSFDLYALGYKLGYNDRMKADKKKGKGAV